MKESLPIQDKFMLTIKEAAQYFGIGIKQIRRLAEDNLDSFAIVIGNRYMIVRPKFEEYIIGILENKNDSTPYIRPERHRRAGGAQP